MKSLLIVGAIIILVVFGALHFRVEPPRAVSDAAIATTSAISSEADWKTYSNDAYGFQFRYPPQFTVTGSFPSFYHVTNGWMQGVFTGDRGTTTETAIVRLLIDEKKSSAGEEQYYYYDAELRIGASREAHDVASCSTADDAMSSSTLRINGTDFTVFDTSQAGMSQSAEVQSYRTVHNGACIAIESIVTFGGTGANAEAIGKPSLREGDKEVMKAIIRTFAFN